MPKTASGWVVETPYAAHPMTWQKKSTPKSNLQSLIAETLMSAHDAQPRCTTSTSLRSEPAT